VYPIVAVSPGATAAGKTDVCCTAGNATAPRSPLADRAPGTAMIHVYRSGGTDDSSHVQSTPVPVPVPCATCTPLELRTVTVHGCAEDRVAVKRTWPSPGRCTSGA